MLELNLYNLSMWIEASPLEGNISPVKIRNVVVLPAPLTPNRPKHSPGETAKLTPRTPVNLKLNFLTKSSTIKSGADVSSRIHMYKINFIFKQIFDKKL